jgi:hypothetical protein
MFFICRVRRPETILASDRQSRSDAPDYATVAVGCVAIYNLRIRSTISQRRTGAK